MKIKTIENLSKLEQVYRFTELILNLPKDHIRNLDFYKNVLKTTPQFLIYSEEDGVIKGALLAIPESSSGILIGELAVSEGSRGMGVGSLLLNEIENIAKRNGKRSILLGSLDTAEKFYEKHGYIPKLFIQLTGEKRLGELKKFAFQNNVTNLVSWEDESNGYSKIIIDVNEINRGLKDKADNLPGSHTQFLFFKEI